MRKRWAGRPTLHERDGVDRFLPFRVHLIAERHLCVGATQIDTAMTQIDISPAGSGIMLWVYLPSRRQEAVG